MNKQIFITGQDWDRCYLNEYPIEMKARREQVLDDLRIEVKQRQGCIEKGDSFEIDVLDHSMAFEMFEIEEITDDAITFIYVGGAS